MPAIELTDVIVKAWAMALARVTPSDQSGIALVIGESRPVIRDVASKSLTAIAAARRETATATEAQSMHRARSSSRDVPGIASVAHVLQPPQTTMLSIGSPRRAPVEAADGSVKFESVMTVTLSCDPRAVDTWRSAPRCCQLSKDLLSGQ